MSGDEWTYRFGTIDHLARSGEVRHGGEKYQFPVLLDPIEPVGAVRVVHPDIGWDGVMLTIRDLETPETIHEAMRTALSETLESMGASSLLSIVATARKGLFQSSEEGLSKLPIDVQQYFGLVGRDPRKAAGALAGLTLDDPVHRPIYLPGFTDHGNLEALFYLGIEVFDTVRARKDAMSGLFYTDIGPIPYERLTRTGTMLLSCGCKGCGLLKDTPPVTAARKAIMEHNIEHLRRRLEIADLALQEGKLRELVMSRMAGNPGWMSALRSVEGYRGVEIDGSIPSFRNIDRTMVTYRDDLNAPDFTGWRRSIVQRYVPIAGRSVLLLLPCSARKPYSTSRTHRRIREALNGLKGWKGKVQQVVVTSPLGAVPMELEDLYPASHYDIPVTGEWFPEELEASRELVSSIFRKGSFGHVVCFHREGREFFPPDISDKIFPGASFQEIHSIAGETGEDPYQLLARTLRDILPEGRDTHHEREELSALVRFSLGVDIGSLKGIDVRWSRRGREMRKGKEPIIVFKKGGPVPTSLGGGLLWDLAVREGGRRVVIDDFHPKGTIFSQGVVGCSEDVRTGDIVLVGTEDEYRGVGRALVPAVFMTGDVHGPAVKMVHSVK